ncbi:cob(I)yrinic acid a,c-diamide adenosyltransferase, mitochondrial-like [Trichogramma pretiosum]|uniref:cob(I)yrinic acid a,c-diamide adenosyltransferase, mitochondrial-like n=1 Tax=Trichogramma pretiosum TaxID=7493 RepID=UPI0006C944EE|nr:cob(I)yrinic acid a,c-diamide adenosyltransferase, mitochondrial-like [Trichogramma pretiosum]
MELARNFWSKSLFAYKSSVRSSFKNSLNKFSSSPETHTTPKVADLEDKITDEKIHNALGATNELTCYLGLAREFANESKEEHPYKDKLKRVQMILFDLHYSILRSTPGEKKLFENRHTKDLEEWIQEYSKQLPPPEDYIVPGGGKACASLHIARSICKRAEHSVIPLVNNGILDKKAQDYLKCLAEFLLTTSRIAAKCDKRTENIYIPSAEVTKEK